MSVFDEDEGVVVTPEVEELEDGSAVFTMPAEEEVESEDFGENLALRIIPESELTLLGAEWCELVATDKKSREQRDKQYAEGIKRTGLGGEAPGGAQFDGASRAVHPMLAKGCVEFASKSIKELFPASGPCKTQIIGEATDAKVDKAERKKTYMNWQLTSQVEENRAEYERLLSQLPLGGSQYKRWWRDEALKRPRTETVYVDDVFLPYDQADFYSSYRVTHRQFLNSTTYKDRVASKLYRDLDLVAPPVGQQDMSKAKAAAEKVEGSEEDTSAYNAGGLREVYQIYIRLELDSDPRTKGESAPYIAHVDLYSERILGVYRNWKEADELRAKKHWMVEYNFIPWRGAYGIGLGHLIGSLSGAATGVLRAILDGAHIQNFPGGLKLKGGRNSGQTVTINATELVELEAPPGVDDIRKLVMGLPFSGPAPMLHSVLEWLTQQAEGAVSTASEKIADGQRDMPVGTALALIEHGAVNFSAIHSRLHASLRKELEILHRLNAEHLEDQETVEELGELVVSRADFQGPMDIIPVSDPNIFSEAQRYAQLQAVLQLRADPQFAQFFKPDRLLQRALRLLQLPSPEDIATLPKDPMRLSALEENFTVGSKEPRPLKVYEDQDDFCHLEAHTHFMSSPMFGASPWIGPLVLPALLEHCREHMMLFYKKHTQAAAKMFLLVAQHYGYDDITEEKAQNQGAAFADQIMAELLGPQIIPALMAAQAKATELAPKPPASPDTLLVETTKKELKQLELTELSKREELERQATMAENAKDRESTLQAAGIAAAIEKASQETSRQLAEFSAQVNVLRDSQSNYAKQMMADFEARQERQMIFLQHALGGGPGAKHIPENEEDQLEASAAHEDAATLPYLMSELLRSTREAQATSGDSQKVLQALLMETTRAVSQMQGTTKFSEFVKDANGNTLGVKTSVVREPGA